MNREDQKKEALARLEILKAKGLMPVVYNKFKKKNSELYYSFPSPLGGILYYFNDLGGIQNKWYTLLKEFEEFYKALVYHVIYHRIDGDGVLMFLYVSNQRHEWDIDREELMADTPFVYACNVTNPLYSEYGNTEIAVRGGGIIIV